MPSQLTFSFSTELLKSHLVSGETSSVRPTLHNQLCALSVDAQGWDVDYTHTRDDNHVLASCHEVYHQIKETAANFPGTHLESSNCTLASDSSTSAKKLSAEVGAVLAGANTHSMLARGVATHTLTFRLPVALTDLQLLKKLSTAVVIAQELGEFLLKPVSQSGGTPLLSTRDELLDKISKSTSLRYLQKILQNAADKRGYLGVYWGQFSEQSFFEIRGRQGKLDPIAAEMWCRFWTGVVKGALKNNYHLAPAAELDEAKVVEEWARDRVLSGWYKEQSGVTLRSASRRSPSLPQILSVSDSRLTLDSGYVSGSSGRSSSAASMQPSDPDEDR